MSIHQVIALILAIIYLLIFTGNVDYYSGFNSAQQAVNNLSLPHKAMRGISVVYLLAAFSCCCLFFPDGVSQRLSPRVGGLQERLLTAKFWIIVGYFSSLTLFITLEVFR